MYKFFTAASKLSALTAFHLVGLLNVLKSTFAGAWGTRLRVTRLVRPALPPLRDEQVREMRASHRNPFGVLVTHYPGVRAPGET